MPILTILQYLTMLGIMFRATSLSPVGGMGVVLSVRVLKMATLRYVYYEIFKHR